MATTQLSLFNGALRLLGERKIASTTENREPVRVLNDIWNDGAREHCLEEGLWNFAIRAVKLTKSPTVTPAFGYQNAFDKPSDWVRTVAICEDEYFNVPLLQMVEEVDFWFSDLDPIYVRYVSDNASYGLDMTRWPESFKKFVEAYLALEAAPVITNDENRVGRLAKLYVSRRTDARSRDAMSDPTAFPPMGNWLSARQGGNRKDRGNRNSLIG